MLDGYFHVHKTALSGRLSRQCKKTVIEDWIHHASYTKFPTRQTNLLRHSTQNFYDKGEALRLCLQNSPIGMLDNTKLRLGG